MIDADLSPQDRQLKFSAILPDFADNAAWMADASAKVDAAGLRRIGYGDDPRQWIEVAGRPAEDLVPVFIHGGYWRALDAQTHRFLMPMLGHVWSQQVNVEYRLMPGVRMRDVVDDVTRALETAADDLQRRLILIGHSAGGHLAWLAGTRLADSGIVAATVSISGVFDLEPIGKSFLQEEINLTDDEIAAWSPVRWPAVPTPPTLFLVGENETDPFHRQPRAMADLHGGDVAVVSGVHHQTILRDFDREEGARSAIRRFADSVGS